MFFNLVYRNAQRSRKENLIYFFTLVTAVASFYIILSLEKQDVVLYLKEFESDAINRLLGLMPLLYVFALFLLFFLVLFANRYQLERRSKEFGVYLLLGMQQKRLFWLLMMEGVLTSLFALFMGIVTGGLLAEIISLTTSRLIGQGIIGHQISFSFQAVLYTAVGFLVIQIAALFILGNKLFKEELHSLLYGGVEAIQQMGNAGGNWLMLLSGSVSLGVAYWIVLIYFKLFHLMMLLLAVVLGIIGTILVIRGVARLLNAMALRTKKNETKGLYVFTIRQLQETIANRSTSVAIASILLMLAMLMLANGSSIILSSSEDLENDQQVYDFTVLGENDEVEAFLTSDVMAPYVENLNPLAMGYLKTIEDIEEGPVDWSKLRAQIVSALPEDVEDPGNTGSTSMSGDYPEALNLLGALDYRLDHPYTIPLSAYNRLLGAAGEEKAMMNEDEVSLYLNTRFMTTDQDGKLPVLESIIDKARFDEEPLIQINDKAYQLTPLLPMKGLVTDRSITITAALIIPDALFEELVDPVNQETYWNFTIPDVLVEKEGLMAPMKEASDLISTTSFQFESYLQNFGRQLFYVVAGSYTLLYLGFLFLVIGCTVLALQFLTQMRQTRKRYQTLTYLGAGREQMKASIRKQVSWYFLFPLIPACISGIVGIRAMQLFLVPYISNPGVFIPFVLAMVMVFLFILLVYAFAVYRTAVGEMDQLRWKPTGE
ncbi:MAG TPA: ABC transporter permease [Candidatus Jeotgalibaca pullicola]|nr:ABC transporter permease [Candidatus Jeotgalibaca pullicola]